jgi:hypothetical protein
MRVTEKLPLETRGNDDIQDLRKASPRLQPRGEKTRKY